VIKVLEVIEVAVVGAPLHRLVVQEHPQNRPLVMSLSGIVNL